MSLSPQILGLVIGGLVPAVMYGLSTVSQKGALTAGMGVGPSLAIAGIAITLTGVALAFFLPVGTFSTKSTLLSLGLGFAWGIGTGGVAIGIAVYGAPLGKLVPLYNFNTLIAVILALWMFQEWREVHAVKLMIGALLIMSGGILVARS